MTRGPGPRSLLGRRCRSGPLPAPPRARNWRGGPRRRPTGSAAARGCPSARPSSWRPPRRSGPPPPCRGGRRPGARVRGRAVGAALSPGSPAGSRPYASLSGPERPRRPCPARPGEPRSALLPRFALEMSGLDKGGLCRSRSPGESRRAGGTAPGLRSLNGDPRLGPQRSGRWAFLLAGLGGQRSEPEWPCLWVLSSGARQEGERYGRYRAASRARLA